MSSEDLQSDSAVTGTETGPPPYRIQSAMVLFALEEALGTFVVQAAPQPDAVPPAMRAEIEKRINGAGFVPVSQIVQETYLKEVIDLAATASKGRSEHEALTRLRKLVALASPGTSLWPGRNCRRRRRTPG